MFCKNCGQTVTPGRKFCRNCGFKIPADGSFVNRNAFTGLLERHRILVVVVIIIVGIIVMGIIKSNSGPSTHVEESKSNIASSVVNILCTSKSGNESGGSGTILTSDGIILTNAHVIPQFREIPNVTKGGCVVVLPDETTGQPKEIYLGEPHIVKGLSKEYDIATLQISAVYADKDGKSWGVFPNNFPEFKDNDACKDETINLGDSVKIYGYPVTSGGYNLTVTEGVISSFTDEGTILTSAKIDSGNSGGLAVSKNGCFVGIPSAVVKGNYQNLGVIIPPNLISEFADKVPDDSSTSSGDAELTCYKNECYFQGECVKRPSNSYCLANSSTSAWKCNSGYIKSAGSCIKPTPVPIVKSASQLCQEKYGWNTYSDGTYCQCNTGYAWNKSSTACITKNQQCSADFPNTGWDGTYNSQGGPVCGCITGYVWNTSQSACVTKESVDQSCRDKYGYDSYYLGYVESGKYMCK